MLPSCSITHRLERGTRCSGAVAARYWRCTGSYASQQSQGLQHRRCPARGFTLGFKTWTPLFRTDSARNTNDGRTAPPAGRYGSHDDNYQVLIGEALRDAYPVLSSTWRASPRYRDSHTPLLRHGLYSTSETLLDRSFPMHNPHL